MCGELEHGLATRLAPRSYASAARHYVSTCSTHTSNWSSGGRRSRARSCRAPRPAPRVRTPRPRATTGTPAPRTRRTATPTRLYDHHHAPVVILWDLFTCSNHALILFRPFPGLSVEEFSYRAYRENS